MQGGDKFGPYELVSPLGAGGMGEVWKARDTRLDRFVAVKISREAFNDRFLQEARIKRSSIIRTSAGFMM